MLQLSVVLVVVILPFCWVCFVVKVVETAIKCEQAGCRQSVTASFFVKSSLFNVCKTLYTFTMMIITSRCLDRQLGCQVGVHFSHKI